VWCIQFNSRECSKQAAWWCVKRRKIVHMHAATRPNPSIVCVRKRAYVALFFHSHTMSWGVQAHLARLGAAKLQQVLEVKVSRPLFS